MTPFSANAPIVSREGRATREFIAFLQGILNGVIKRSTYTAAQLATMTPEVGATAFCVDSSVDVFNDVLAGGGAFNVPVHGDGTDWRIG